MPQTECFKLKHKPTDNSETIDIWFDATHSPRKGFYTITIDSFADAQYDTPEIRELAIAHVDNVLIERDLRHNPFSQNC